MSDPTYPHNAPQQPPQGWQAPPSYGPPEQPGQQPSSGYGQPQPLQAYGQPQPVLSHREAKAEAHAAKAHAKSLRPWFKKKRFLVPLVLVALFVLTRLGGAGDDPGVAAGVPAASPARGTKAPAATKSPEAQAPASAAAQIGDKITAGDWTFKVTKFTCGVSTVGDRYLNKKAQGQYCLLSLNATNNGDSEGTLDHNNLKLLANGKEFSSDYEASVYENSDSALFMEGVNPGNTAKALVVFDVPKKVKPTQVSLAGGFFGTKSATVDLT